LAAHHHHCCADRRSPFGSLPCADAVHMRSSRHGMRPGFARPRRHD
jgi:hypothetical protein